MILRFIVVIMVLYLLYRLFRTIFLLGSGRQDGEVGKRKLAGREDLVEDPWCHTYVPEGDAYKASIDSETIYFCSQKCYAQYKAMRNGEMEGKKE